MSSMNAAVLDCLVAGYEPLIPSIILPDPDDRHVVAAAIRAGAQVIVTANLKDFQGDDDGSERSKGAKFHPHLMAARAKPRNPPTDSRRRLSALMRAADPLRAWDPDLEL